MHSEFITVDGGKMSKSLGNVYTVQDLIDRGYDPLAYRYFVLGGHYRSKMNFTWEALDGAQNALNKLREIVREWPVPSGPPPSQDRFLAALNDDLATSQALAIVWELVNDPAIPVEEKAATLLDFDRVLGLGLEAYVGKRVDVPADVAELVVRRDAARAAKDWGESDRLRAEIAARGFSVEDGANGSSVRAIL